MKPQVEAKFLNMNHDTMRQRLMAAGAQLAMPMRGTRRVNMDFPDRRLQTSRNGWVRIRDEFYQVTLKYKQLGNHAGDGVLEAESLVGDFDDTKKVLEAIGLESKAYMESRRESWHIGDVKIVLDQWPHVRPYCEVEGESMAIARQVAESLGLRWDDAIFGSIQEVYKAEYDITDEEFYGLNDISFGNDPPQLLTLRRRPGLDEPEGPTEQTAVAIEVAQPDLQVQSAGGEGLSV